MRVKITTSCFGKGFNYSAGDVKDVTEKLGKDLISAGFASEIKSAKSKKETKSAGGGDADA